jgi:hypothetical protein
MNKLRTALALLIQEQPLPQTYLDHPLKGSWKGHRGAHIEPDWILVYRIAGNDLHLTRTGPMPIYFLSDIFTGYRPLPYCCALTMRVYKSVHFAGPH